MHAKRAVLAIRWQEGNCWWLRYHDGKEHEAKLAGDSLSLPFLIVLNFKLINSNAKQTVCLYKDSVSDGVHRRLRARLKTQADKI